MLDIGARTRSCEVVHRRTLECLDSTRNAGDDKRQKSRSNSRRRTRSGRISRDELKKHMEHSTLIHRERQMRRKRKLSGGGGQTPQDMAEQAAAIAEACAEMDKLHLRRAPRQNQGPEDPLQCFERNHAAATARWRGTALAVVEDASTMVDELLKTKEGRQRLKFQMQLYYGKSLFASWTDGNNCRPPLHVQGLDEESVTMATALKMATARRSDLSAAREHARNVLLGEQVPHRRGRRCRGSRERKGKGCVVRPLLPFRYRRCCSILSCRCYYLSCSIAFFFFIFPLLLLLLTFHLLCL